MQKDRFILGILLGTLLGGAITFLFLQRKMNYVQLQFRQFEHERQIQIADSLKRLDQAGLMSNMLTMIDEDLKGKNMRSLNQETIDRIAAMCYVFRPYRYAGSDTTASKILSPERGQLLHFLVSMHLDSNTWRQISARVDFSNADLRNGKLSNAYLQGINLKNAFLQNANLEGSDLTDADLHTATLWGANLKNATLAGADLVRTDLQWVDLRGCDVQRANLTGAKLNNSQIRNTDFSHANLEATDLNNSIIYNANFAGAKLFRTSWKKATLHNVDFNGTTMTYADFIDTNLDSVNLSSTELSGVTVSDKDWLKKLNMWAVIGGQEINAHYHLVEEPNIKPRQFRLEKTKK